MKKKRKIVNIIFNIFVGLILFFIVVRTIFPHVILDVTGYNWYLVASGSMEPVIMTNDTVIVKKVNNVNTLNKGDIIIFTAQIDGSEKLVIHYFDHIDGDRIVTYSESGLRRNPDNPYDPQSWDVMVDDVIAVLVWRVPSAPVYKVVRNPIFIITASGAIILIIILVARKKEDRNE